MSGRVNTEHLNDWIEDLRTTTAPQVRQSLEDEAESGATGYCCLGRGCVVAKIPHAPDDRGFMAGASPTNTLAPSAFHEWLGITANANVDTVYLDWPAELVSRECHTYGCDDIEIYEVGDKEVERCTNDRHPKVRYLDDDDTQHAAALNDDLGLTFPQIADVLAWAGVRDTPTGPVPDEGGL